MSGAPFGSDAFMQSGVFGAVTSVCDTTLAFSVCFQALQQNGGMCRTSLDSLRSVVAAAGVLEILITTADAHCCNNSETTNAFKHL